MKTYLEIVADTNDADYITERTEISDEELARIQPVIDLLKSKNRRHNWETGEIGDPCVQYHADIENGIVSEELIEEFNEDYVPYGEYGVHTIKEINLIKVAEEKSLL